MFANCRMMTSRIGMSPFGIRGFGNTTVLGRSRVPLPPARITASLDIVDSRLVTLQILSIAETVNRLAQTFPDRGSRLVSSHLKKLPAIADQAFDFTACRTIALLVRNYLDGGTGHFLK